MPLAHIGLNITWKDDIELFYIDLLNMKLQYEFDILSEQAKHIFGFAHDIRVTMVQKDGLALELFQVPADICSGYSPCFEHLCLYVADRSHFVMRAQKRGYRCDVFPRPRGDLIFIFDRSGNRFEIKQTESSQ